MVRPRTSSPQPDEAIKLGEDLVVWATEKTDEKRCTWSVWYALRHGMIRSHWKALIQMPEFLPYYEIAKAALAQRIHNDELEKGMAHRYIRMYDRELREDEDEKAKQDAELKSKNDDNELAKLAANAVGKLADNIKLAHESNKLKR